MTLLIDNYDSFSYNLYQLIGMIDPDIKVIRNDAMKPSEIKDLNPSRIVISPGPGKPSDAGICEEVIKMYRGVYPILGVCLGHQAICEVEGDLSLQFHFCYKITKVVFFLKDNRKSDFFTSR